MQKHPKILMPIHIIIQCFYRESSIISQKKNNLSQKKHLSILFKYWIIHPHLKKHSNFIPFRNIIKTTQEKFQLQVLLISLQQAFHWEK